MYDYLIGAFNRMVPDNICVGFKKETIYPVYICGGEHDHCPGCDHSFNTKVISNLNIGELIFWDEEEIF